MSRGGELELRTNTQEKKKNERKQKKNPATEGSALGRGGKKNYKLGVV